MITTDDVLAAVRVKWAAAGLNALIPAANVYLGRAGERTVLPYANAVVKLANTEMTSGRLYFQTFEATLEAYTQLTPSPGAVQAALMAAFVGDVYAPAAGLVLAGSRVIHSLLAAGDGTTVTQQRVDGVDVHKVSLRFTILTQTVR